VPRLSSRLGPWPEAGSPVCRDGKEHVNAVGNQSFKDAAVTTPGHHLRRTRTWGLRRRIVLSSRAGATPSPTTTATSTAKAAKKPAVTTYSDWIGALQGAPSRA
jgi:hypothetical protein